MNNPVIAGSSYFEFKSNADVAIFTRLAADAVGATKMDRPEWNGVHPRTGEVYFTLTNNSNRSAATADAVNPRAYTDMKGSKEQKATSTATSCAWPTPRPQARRSSGTSTCSALKPAPTSPR
ncbi:putative phosphatase [Hydrogenophaga sp. T4]|nr:putative phosphatase [Hydrogenophaga sp. T4]